MRYLLDTNVISELRKVGPAKADPNVLRWVDNIPLMEMFISVVTVQELEIGVLRAERNDRAKAQLLRTWLEGQVLTAFANRILPVDLSISLRCASLHVPDPRPFSDTIIAATALVHGMTLVTRNEKDFAGTGVQVLNPWRANANPL